MNKLEKSLLKEMYDTMGMQMPNNIITSESQINPYYAISDGLLILSLMYRNMHLNFDGNSKVDSYFEGFYGDALAGSFAMLHKIRAEDKNDFIPVCFGITQIDRISPIREKYCAATYSKMQVSEAVNFMIDVELTFNKMCETLGQLNIVKQDIAGENMIAEAIDASDLRLLDLDGMSKNI